MAGTDAMGAQMKARYGMIHGRFQPFHLHLTYLRAALELCQTLIIGITNPDPRPSHPRGGGSTGRARPYGLRRRLALARARRGRDGDRPH